MNVAEVRQNAWPVAFRFMPDDPDPTDAAARAIGLPLSRGDSRLDSLLFRPLAPVIVAAPAWRPDLPGIPATALPVLGAVIATGLADSAARIAAMIRHGAGPGGQVIAQAAGPLLWPQAACVLEAAPRPRDWLATGLPAYTYTAIASGVAALLHEAPAIEAAAGDGDSTAFDEDAVHAILTATAARGANAWALMIAVLLARLPQPDELLRMVSSARSRGGAPRLRAATELAIAALLDRLAQRGGVHGPVGALGLREAGLEARRLASLLDAVGANAGPDRRRHAEGLRQRLEVSCQDRFIAGLSEELVGPIRALPPRPKGAMLARLEASARDLRRLATEARRIGNATPYDKLLRQVSAMLKAMGADAPLALIDRVRLVEILTGPEDAIGLLTAQRREGNVVLG